MTISNFERLSGDSVQRDMSLVWWAGITHWKLETQSFEWSFTWSKCANIPDLSRELGRKSVMVLRRLEKPWVLKGNALGSMSGYKLRWILWSNTIPINPIPINSICHSTSLWYGFQYDLTRLLSMLNLIWQGFAWKPLDYRKPVMKSAMWNLSLVDQISSL